MGKLKNLRSYRGILALLVMVLLAIVIVVFLYLSFTNSNSKELKTTSIDFTSKEELPPLSAEEEAAIEKFGAENIKDDGFYRDIIDRISAQLSEEAFVATEIHYATLGESYAFLKDKENAVKYYQLAKEISDDETKKAYDEIIDRIEGSNE